MNLPYEEFEALRAKAIKELQSLHYDNDPHFMVVVTPKAHLINETEITFQGVCGCGTWFIEAVMNLVEDVAKNRHNENG
jgi:hypothetical protein